MDQSSCNFATVYRGLVVANAVSRLSFCQYDVNFEKIANKAFEEVCTLVDCALWFSFKMTMLFFSL